MYIKGFALKTFGNVSIRKEKWTEAEKERERERQRERERKRQPEIPKEIVTMPPLGAKNDKKRNYLFIATT